MSLFNLIPDGIRHPSGLVWTENEHQGPVFLFAAVILREENKHWE